jgi:HD superfamily phosphodiesterase
MKSTDKLCSKFVYNICKGRDESHGYSHMKQVMLNSMIIYHGERMNNPYIKNLCKVVAWLHDVADHKYDVNNQLENKVKCFLSKYFPEDSDLILNIIQRISYSKEVKNGRADWLAVLGEIGLAVRNIVSDADKLEAIGEIGINRCIQYSKDQYRKSKGVDIPLDILYAEINNHANEKLLRLKDEFIITDTGKHLAEPLHHEMILALLFLKYEKK